MLTVSIVTHNSDLVVLKNLLTSLVVANSKLTAVNRISELIIIDNSNQPLSIGDTCKPILEKFNSVTLLHSKTNMGYGRAHNMAINKCHSTFHLLLNPDVLLHCDALKNGIAFLEEQPGIVAVSPCAVNGQNRQLYLAKKFPSLFVLLLRSLGVNWLNKCFAGIYRDYEYYPERNSSKIFEAELVSGCFILCRTDVLKSVQGFDEKYFLYFEDFALSIKLREIGKISYLSSMKIQHFGGEASRKGLKHIYYFLSSAFKFYQEFGWKII